MSDCYKCEYRSRVTFTCDYILYAGTARGCCAENCDKFRQRKGAEISPNIIEIIKLYWQGYSDRAIAKELGISRYVVRAWRISCGYEPNERSIKNRPDVTASKRRSAGIPNKSSQEKYNQQVR